MNWQNGQNRPNQQSKPNCRNRRILPRKQNRKFLKISKVSKNVIKCVMIIWSKSTRLQSLILSDFRQWSQPDVIMNIQSVVCLKGVKNWSFCSLENSTVANGHNLFLQSNPGRVIAHCKIFSSFPPISYYFTSIKNFLNDWIFRFPFEFRALFEWVDSW